MRNTSKRLLIAGVLGVALALPGAAGATITVSGTQTAGAYTEPQLSGFPGYTPVTLTPFSPTDDNGFHDGTVTLTPGLYSFEYWGSGNSDFNNFFTVNASANYSISGAQIFSNAPGGTGAGGYGGGYTLLVTATTALDFTFSTDGPPTCSVNSGAPVSETTACDYLAATQGYASGGGTQSAFTAFLGFSDRNEGIDHDHQDLTIRINEIPEPATLALLGSGLLGLGLIRRRRAA